MAKKSECLYRLILDEKIIGDNLTHNQAIVRLFSYNTVEIYATTIDKIGTFDGHPFYQSVSLAKFLLV